MTNAMLQLNIAGSTGATYVCQISTNLVSWIPVSTNVNLSGTIRLQVSPPAPSSRNFYRAVVGH
jgi:hypothetical protein